MGCDIHPIIEVRGKDGIWRLQRDLRCNQCAGTGLLRRDHGYPGFKDATEKCFWCNGHGQRHQGYSGRNYNLFGVLAGVRNDSIPRISDPRGLPSDMSFQLTEACGFQVYLGDNGRTTFVGVPQDEEEQRKAAAARLWAEAGAHGRPPGLPESEDDDEENDYYDTELSLGDHSHSWLTLAEMLNHNYEAGSGHEGWVNPANFVRFEKYGRPSSWCGSVGGGSIKHISNEEMRHYCQENHITDSGADRSDFSRLYTHVSWGESARKAIGPDWFQWLDWLKTLGDPADVRMIFGFDS
jgi:hypothetical protein